MKSILVLYSYHHGNTQKVAQAIGEVLDAPIVKPHQTDPYQLSAYDLVGFGSGIYHDTLHKTLLDLAGKLPQVVGGRAFIFSTTGAPAFAVNAGEISDYIAQAHVPLREALQSKGYTILDEFCCAGHNTNAFLRVFGGLNKGRPNADDLGRAEAFARRLVQTASPAHTH